MNALSHFYTDISPRGFTLEASPQSSRLLALTFDEATVAAFREATAEWPVQALEYKSMLRFRVAKILDDLCANTLQRLLVETMTDRGTGGSWSTRKASTTSRRPMTWSSSPRPSRIAWAVPTSTP